MRTGEDFRREFPKPEEGFRQAVDNALAGLVEERRWHIHKLGTAVVLTVLALMISGVAVAATIERWGVQEFIERSKRANLSEAAAGVLAADFEDVVIEAEWATLTVTEAVYDGMAIYMAVDAVPKHTGDMAIPAPVGHGGMADYYGKSYPSDVSIEAYAAQLGYEHVLALICECDEATTHIYDSVMNEDGSFTIMLWGLVREQHRNQPRLEVNFCIRTQRDGAEYKRTAQRLGLRIAGEMETARSAKGETGTLGNAGIIITGVEVYRTPMSTYVLADYDVADQARHEEYIMHQKLRFLDEKGVPLRAGAYPLAYNSRYDIRRNDVPQRYYYISNWLMDEMPEQIAIGEYDGSAESGWTEGKTCTFHLK